MRHNPLANPLLRLVRKSPLRLGGFHRAQVLVFALGLLTYAGMVAVWIWARDHGIREIRQPVGSWVFVVGRLYAVLIGAFATLIPAFTVLIQFMRIDYHRQWEALLLTPISSGQWLARLLLPASFPSMVFLVGMGLIVFWGSYHPKIFDYFSMVEICLYMVPIYVPVQCLWSAGVTLFFLSSHRRLGIGCTWAFPIILAPGGLIFPALWTNDTIKHLALINGVKLLLLIGLLWYLRRTLHTRLTRRIEG